MSKLRYEIDPHNRLVIGDSGEKSRLGRFRRVLDGRFKIGHDNSLVYHVKSPMQGVTPDPAAPHQVKLKGKWSLTKNHDLKLTLNKWRRQRLGDELNLRTELIGADANSFLFAVTARTKEGAVSTNILKLQGVWQADKQNRLTFRAKKEKGTYNILTLDGIWEIDKNHRIIYRYEKARLKRKRRLKKTITFKGFWDITKKNRLSYKLDLKGKSVFDFQVSAGVPDKNSIKYEVGIGRAHKYRPVKRIVMLFGRWKIKKNIGLLFQIEYEKCRPHAVIFGADVKLTKKHRIQFKLRNKLGEDLGMNLTLSKKLLRGDGEAFLRLLKSKKESSIYAGMAWGW